MDYLHETQYIPHVDRNDDFIGPIERWEAHKKGILHRAFTLTIWYKDEIIIQHRKHPVFDMVFDTTISSHPLVIDGKTEDMMTAIYRTLEREWHIQKNILNQIPKKIGQIYYQAPDPYSAYQEHEICHIYTCKVESLPLPDTTTAYGFSLMKKEQIIKQSSAIHTLYAPWVQSMIKEGLL